MTGLADLLRPTPALWDGGMGSLLLAEGLCPGAAPETWNIEKPQVIKRFHEAYFQAGAQVAQTNTFGGNRTRLTDSNCPYSVAEVCHAAVSIAREVRPKGKLVAGNIGPSGLMLPPLGAANETELASLFAEQAKALCTAGVDLLSIETMSDAREARAALRGARHVSAVPVVVSMTFKSTPKGYFTVMGDAAASTLISLLDEGADGVGANCTLSAEDMVTLALELRREIDGLLLIQPNAGNPEVSAGQTGVKVAYPEGPAEFAAALQPLFKAGIELVGGCCGTTPAHIEALAGVLRFST